mgnify:FL=1
MILQGFGHGMGIGMGWGWIIGLIVLVLIVLIIVKAVGQNTGAVQNSGKTPLEVLKERYAKGEIDKEEFEQKKKDLTS